MEFTMDDPIKYTDEFDNEYEFYLSKSVHDNRTHMMITIFTKDRKSSHYFAQPIINDVIDWYYWPIQDGERIQCMSEEAVNFANKIVKMKAFL